MRDDRGHFVIVVVQHHPVDLQALDTVVSEPRGGSGMEVARVGVAFMQGPALPPLFPPHSLFFMNSAARSLWSWHSFRSPADIAWLSSNKSNNRITKVQL